jgi:peptidoglycan/LPS O-acetylase OafA/YrhL
VPFRTLSSAVHSSACDAALAAPSPAAPMRALDSLRGLAALAVVFTHLLSSALRLHAA